MDRLNEAEIIKAADEAKNAIAGALDLASLIEIKKFRINLCPTSLCKLHSRNLTDSLCCKLFNRSALLPTTATTGQTLFTLPFTYDLGGADLYVFVNGLTLSDVLSFVINTIGILLCLINCRIPCIP